jgi:hypothetical protein
MGSALLQHEDAAMQILSENLSPAAIERHWSTLRPTTLQQEMTGAKGGQHGKHADRGWVKNRARKML